MRNRGIGIPALWLAAACGGACTPTLDWRDVQPAGSRLQLLMPCKPASHARRIVLAGASVEMTLFACEAGGDTYAVGFADLRDPGRVTVALEELARAAQANLRATTASRAVPARIEGMTPNAGATRLSLQGQLPDGRAVTEAVVVFAYGTSVMQATVVGARPDAAAVETFIESLRVRS
jgi:hypothetical protein